MPASQSNSDTHTMTGFVTTPLSYLFDFSQASASRELWRVCSVPNDALTPIRDIRSVGVYVVDVAVYPTTAPQTTTAPLTLTYTASIAIGADQLTWVRDSLPCPTSTSSASGDTSASIAAPASGAVAQYDMSLITFQSTLRLCVLAQGGDVLDYYNVKVVVFNSLSIDPTSVEGFANQMISFDYVASISLQDTVWFLRTRDPTNNQLTQCTDYSPPLASTTLHSDSRQPPLSGSSAAFDFSGVTAASIDQNQFRLCAQSQANNQILDFSPVGLWVVNIVISPSTVGLQNETIQITYDYNSTSQLATGGSSLNPGDSVFFQLDDQPCSVSPNTAGSGRSSPATIGFSGASYVFDFSSVNQSAISSYARLRMCVIPGAQSSVEALDYSGICVQVVDVEVISAASVRPEASQARTQ